MSRLNKTRAQLPRGGIVCPGTRFAPGLIGAAITTDAEIFLVLHARYWNASNSKLAPQ
jgi:hypothetical protein